VGRQLCFFVPPHVLANIVRVEAQSGVGPTAAQRTAVISAELRQLRRSRQVTSDVTQHRAQPKKVAGLTVPPAGTAGLEIYDDQNQSAFDVALVRGEGDPAVGGDGHADNAYDDLDKVREFYKQVLNRDSIDNAGLVIDGNVNYGVDFDNAFWDGQRMVFGNGDNVIFKDFTGDIDVPGHELTHGVTQYTAGLQYTNDQTGALNESFSDMMGSAIDAWSRGIDDAAGHNWLIGEDIMADSLAGEALRSMAEPGTAYDNPTLGRDPQPRDMSGYFEPADPHIMSGITNRWFYLICAEIGITAGAQLMYQTLQKLWPTAKFADAAEVAAAQARILANEKKLAADAAQIVRAAARQQGFW
jgi:Zn-dependent metalloprotease